MVKKYDGIEELLDWDGQVRFFSNGCSFRITAKKSKVTKFRPHGIKYSITLHDRDGRRVMGMDNAHHATSGQNRKKTTERKVTYDHLHNSGEKDSVPYEFVSAYQLLEDFFKAANKILDLN